MDPNAKDKMANEVLLTTDPKIIMRRPVRDKEQYAFLLKILAAVLGSVVAILLLARFKHFL